MMDVRISLLAACSLSIAACVDIASDEDVQETTAESEIERPYDEGGGGGGSRPTPPPSAVSPATPARDHRDTQRDIADVLERTPGARQISATEIEVAPGLIMSLTQRATTNVQDDHCQFLYLCAFAHSDFGSPSLKFTTCGREWNLGKVAYPGGGWWNDKISSIINNQSRNTPSFFYNYTGSGNNWQRILSLNSGNYLRNLAWDTAEGGGTPSDRIDGVHVCGSVPSPWVPNWP
jgi:hypothetical protein